MFNSLLLVLLIGAVAWAGSAIGLAGLFGVALPYVAVVVFIGGMVWRMVYWAKSPVPFCIPTTGGQEQSLDFIKQNKIDCPSTTWGVVKRMFFEVFLFRSLFRNTYAEVREFDPANKGPRTIYYSSKWLWAFALLWALNAFFQGWGAPVCARLLTAWYSRNERGGWWAIWNTAHNVGGALIPMVVGAAALHYGWRAGMMIAGGLAIVAGLFLCWRLRDRPQTVGLPPVGDWRHDEMEIAQQQEGAGLSRQQILTKYVLKNPYIWLLSLCYVLVYVVRAAINDWGNLYMSETLGVDLVTANSAVTMFELGGFIGALVAGWGSDKLFNGNRGPMNLIFAAGILLSVGSLWLMPFASYVMQAACFFTIGFFVFGPQMLIGMAAAECSHKEAAGAATGFVGLFAYLGASLSGWPLARVIDIWHWSGFFAVIAIAAGISALLLLPFLHAQAPREA